MTEGNAGAVVVVDRPQQPGWHRQVALLLGVTLVVGWVVWAGLTWQSQTRYVTLANLESDLAAGHVTGYLIVTNVRPTRTWPGPADPDSFDLPALDAYGNIDHSSGATSLTGAPALMYFTDHRIGPTRVLDPARFSTSTEEQAQRLRAAGVTSVRGTDVDVPVPSDRYVLWGLVLGLLALGSVLFGPRPRAGTRFFWFWVIGVVGGLGVLAYAVCEPLRQGRGSAVDVGAPGEPPVEGRRLRGWQGFLLAFVVSGLLTMVVGTRGTHLDGVLFPHW